MKLIIFFEVFLINTKAVITFLKKEISSDLVHNYDFLYQESSKKDNLRAATAHFTWQFFLAQINQMSQNRQKFGHNSNKTLSKRDLFCKQANKHVVVQVFTRSALIRFVYLSSLCKAMLMKFYITAYRKFFLVLFTV